MKADEDDALEAMLREEGGFAQRPSEPGGAVNHGISMCIFIQWCKKHKRPKPTIFDLRAVTPVTAKLILGELFADAVRFADLPAGIDEAELEAGENMGLGWLHRTLAHEGTVTVDKVCDAWLNAKRDRVAKNPADAHFLAGWTKRIGEVRQRAKEYALKAAKK
jgi:lysozyme family protein